ncbi:hypothetical protein I3760_12G106900 [Carya illinoinensis]|nr:hypothetical protein I3760_12G106900 [Carya illinoinensis]
MQSSLSYSHHGRSGFDFQRSTKPKINDASASRLPPIRCGMSSNNDNTNGARSFGDWIEFFGQTVWTAFPIWVALGCLLVLVKPSSFSWVRPKLTVLDITFTMLGVGVMPLSGFLVSKLLNLPSYYAAGLILVGCCPGTASNIVTFIARGNVALSVLMTAASTLAAVIIHDSFSYFQTCGKNVAVDAAGLLVSTLQVVLLPALAGAFLNQYFQSLVKFVPPPRRDAIHCRGNCSYSLWKCNCTSASAILMSGQQVVLAASLLHASGFFFSYILSKTLGLDVSSSRTVSIENLVLGVVLATQHFGNPLTAAPCAVSTVCHSIFGSVLAGIWRLMPT